MEIDTVINNLKEMLVDRGDDIAEFEEHETVVERDRFYNDNDLIEFNTDNTTIIFSLTKKVKKNILDSLKSNEEIDLFVKKYNNKLNIILVFNNDIISSTVLSQITEINKYLYKKNGMIQIFRIKQLLYNPTKHILVPKHIKLNQKEISEVMEKYLIKNKLQIPIILQTDVIAKWLGLKQGDVVKIIRNNENSGVSYYYRCCI